MIEPTKVTVHRSMNSLPDDQVPFEELKRRFEVRKEFNFWNLEQDCRSFAEMITTWKEKELYKHFFDTWDDFLADYINKPEDWVNNIVEGVNLLDQTQPIKAQDALEAVIAKAKSQPLAEHGGDRSLVQKTVQQGDNVTLIQKGNNREYLTRRISRDHPEVLDEIGKGKKYRSVRQAAIAVGIVKEKIKIEFPPEESGSQIAGRLYQKLSDEQLTELRDELNQWGDRHTA